MSADQNYIDQLEQDSAKASGGGGFIAQCETMRGFKIYITGLGNRESFFYYKAGDEKARKAAGEKAKQVAQEHGKDKGDDSFLIIAYKATVKGREVTWKDDQFYVQALYTDAFKQVILPSLREHKPPVEQKFWAKIAFVLDPYGGTKKDANGEDRPKMVAYIAQVYKDEAEATADAGTSTGRNGSEPNDPMVPADYNKSDWLGLKGDAEQAVEKAVSEAKNPVAKKKAREAAIAKLAEDWVATVPQVEALLKS